LNYSSHNSW